jgi:hypothetical protein
MDLQQHQKFQAIRQEHRRQLVGKMANPAILKAETGVKQEMQRQQ